MLAISINSIIIKKPYVRSTLKTYVRSKENGSVAESKPGL